MSAETEHKADAIRSSLALLRQHLDWDRSLERLAELQNAVEDQDLWNDQQKAQAIMREKNSLEVMINDVNSITRQLDDAMEMVELAEAEGDEGLVAETLQQLIELELLATRKQLESLLSGEADNNDCFLEINAGAGGTEAQDWALMLLRMYSRWAEQHGYKIEYIE
ncbi:MAG: PCRF domain-containing protein, partial [Candidatus Puniceispirillales bacterium]